jgi:hypothetical protein
MQSKNLQTVSGSSPNCTKKFFQTPRRILSSMKFVCRSLSVLTIKQKPFGPNSDWGDNPFKQIIDLRGIPVKKKRRKSSLPKDQ